MDRVYSSGAAGSAPTEPASPSTGYPSVGNPGTGTPPTKPGAWWYHMIMEELMAIITAASITPVKGTLNQLLTALRSAGVFQTQADADDSTKVATTGWVRSAMSNIATAAGFACSLGSSGYIKFPSWLGGLIIQWGGSVSIAGTAGYTITFPISFSDANSRVVVTPTLGSYFSCSGVTATNFSGTNFTATASGIHWIAIGK